MAHDTPRAVMRGGTIDLDSRVRDMPDDVASLLASRLILREMRTLVALLDRDGVIIEANRRTVAAAPDPTRAIGIPLWDAPWWTISRSTRTRLRDAVRQVAAGEEARLAVRAFIGAARRGRASFDFSIRPIRDDAGRVAMIIAEARDVTEERAAQAQIARQNRELEKLNATLTAIDTARRTAFANVTHELRAPLGVIVSGSDRVLASETLGDEQRAALRAARTNALIALKHVNDLLDTARLDSDRLELELGDGDLAALVRRVADDLRPLAESRRLRWLVQTPDLLPARFDADRLTSVVGNLLANGIKFAREGGTVRCSLQADGDRIRLEVADDGPGIPMEERETAFRRFGQASSGLPSLGTGLGLTIAAQIVRLHGGTIAAGDAPEGGALIAVTLPRRELLGVSKPRSLQQEAAAALRRELALDLLAAELVELRRTANQQQSEAAEEQGRVIVLSDDPATAATLESLLRPHYDVVVTHDHDHALEQARARDVHVLVADTRIAAVDGGELLRALRQAPETQFIPVLVVANADERETRVRLLQAGAQDAIVKPLAPEEVLARVRNLCAQSLLRLRAERAERRLRELSPP